MKPFICLNLLLLLLISSTNVYSQVQKIEAVGMTVSNMDQSIHFYQDVLGFKKINDRELQGTSYEQLEGLFGLRMRVVRLRLGDEFIELTQFLTSGGRSIPEDARSNDLIFQHIAIVVSDMEKAYRHLRKYMVMHVSTGPQTIPADNIAAAGVKAFYFHDPDKHNLELIFFPKGKGQPKWQNVTGRLFLGIDHTAIAITNTDSSLNFYEDLLGIERKGDSWNKGMEQAHLNFVEGANLHITGLRSSNGPGIEFLQYLQPGPGKIAPPDTRADDIWYWQTTLSVKNVEQLYKQLKSAGHHFISKDLVVLSEKNHVQSKAFVVRDRDGHALLIKEYFNQEIH